MPIFAAAIGAVGPKYVVQAMVFRAVSREEAVSKGILSALEEWPTEDEYSGHFCVTAMVPNEWTANEDK